MNAEALKAHVEKLAAAMNITIKYELGTNIGSAALGKPIVTLPVGWNEPNYAVAMHELGHKATLREPTADDYADVLIASTFGAVSPQLYDNEVKAWEWAKSNALAWTEAMIEREQQGLQSYRDGLPRFKAI